MRFHRRTTTRVLGGRPQRKNRWRHEPDYRPTHQIKVERSRAPLGYRHYISPADITSFLALLPDWKGLSIGLQRVLLSDAIGYDGWHAPGTVAVCAWPDHTAQVFNAGYYNEHADIFRRMGVPCRPVMYRRGILCQSCWADLEEDDFGRCGSCGQPAADYYPEPSHDAEGAQLRYVAEFTPASIQAFLLVHVLVHELGHHHDRMASPGQRKATRGEGYAEAYARRHEDIIWPAYCRVFRYGG